MILIALLLIQACSSESGGTPETNSPPSSTGGTNTGSTNAPSSPPLTGGDTDDPPTTVTFSDEFDTDSLAEWQQRHVVEGSPSQIVQLDISQTITGNLTLIPTQTPGWFADGDAPLLFKPVTGDFTVEVLVHAESTEGSGLAPQSNFNSAGLMARNPNGATDPENHIMVNVGRQNNSITGGVGSETKTTVNSDSVLSLDAGSNRGRLTLCRVGDQFTTYRWLDNETEWTRIGSVERIDLPDTLQVGMVANGFTGPDLVATFDYIRLRIPTSLENCVN